MRHYCTYFDARYLPRALALYDSLVRSGGGIRLWALCLDAASEDALRRLGLPGIEVISLREFEAGDEALLAAKANRSTVEYYFTCSPSLPLFVLRRHPEVDLITYLDADLYFYADPEPIFDEIGDASIAIVPHRFAPRVADKVRFGRFNVGWLTFRGDESGLECLNWWRERCLEWCYARQEGDRYADQKYLDRFPELFSNVRVIEHRGVNLGPWNLGNHGVSQEAGEIRVDGDPLICFHFANFRRVASWLYNTDLASWHVRPSALVRRKVVGPYIDALRRQDARLAALPAAVSAPPAPSRAPESFPTRMARKLRAARRICSGLLLQDHLLLLRDRVL